VYSPPIAKRKMYEISGHIAHYEDEMFPPMKDDGGQDLYLRPSLCPHHAMVFASRGRSYRELPLHIAELGAMYRDERSGVLGGLPRVRAVSLNDGHIFCAEGQVVDEVVRELNLMRRAHAAVGVKPRRYRLSMPGDGDKWVHDANWDRAAGLLRAALDRAGMSYVEALGEAAFYGPKLDVQIEDPAGRESTLATIQVDFHQPARFNLSYVDSDGRRSLLGSMERLMAHLLEVHDGALPAWCAPVQLHVLPVGAAQVDAAWKFRDAAIDAGLRAEVDADSSLSSRVRQASDRRVPHVAVFGAREVSEGSVALRSVGQFPVPEALSLLVGACALPLSG
jgi:threonyl-tRNA synthetase